MVSSKSKRHDLSEAWHRRAMQCIPGGVNSPVRAFRAVGRHPLVIESAQGARVTDIDGNTYIDYVGAYGPLVVGHAHPKVVEAIQRAAAAGTAYGAPTRRETELAERICAAFPSIEMVRLVNSGTEAVMTAIRLARGATGRPLILKFEGCYHGHADPVLVGAGSGAAAVPGSVGVSKAAASETLVVPYNNIEALNAAVDAYGDQLAAIIVEPVAGNMGLVLPAPGFLAALRAAADRCGALLIFDEVITGFRVGPHGAQGRYNVMPDLTCLGKTIGGGLPIGAFGGRRELMELMAPIGPVYQAGTLSGNPIATAAGLATLQVLDETPNAFEFLEERATHLAQGFTQILRAAGIPASSSVCGGIAGLHLREQPPTNFTEANDVNKELFARLFWALIDRGVYLGPAPMETNFVSLAHGEAEIEATLDALHDAVQELVAEGI